MPPTNESREIPTSAWRPSPSQPPIFSHSSRGTYAAGTLVFAAVIGDAALIAEVIDVDAQGRTRAVPGRGAAAGECRCLLLIVAADAARDRGRGGEMWYEARHFGAGRGLIVRWLDRWVPATSRMIRMACFVQHWLYSR